MAIGRENSGKAFAQRNVERLIAARALYGRISTPVTVVCGEHDWWRMAERKPTSHCYQLPDRSRFLTPDTSPAWNSPPASPEILLDNPGASH